jgi:hypothetical protein
VACVRYIIPLSAFLFSIHHFLVCVIEKPTRKMTGFLIITPDICNPYFPVSFRRLYVVKDAHNTWLCLSSAWIHTLAEMTQTRKRELISNPDEINWRVCISPLDDTKASALEWVCGAAVIAPERRASSDMEKMQLSKHRVMWQGRHRIWAESILTQHSKVNESLSIFFLTPYLNYVAAKALL